MDRTEDKNMDEEDEAGNSGEEDDIQSIRLAAPAPFYFPNHLENKEVIPLVLLTHWQFRGNYILLLFQMYSLLWL